MSTLACPRILVTMSENENDQRVTRVEAARRAGVSPRTISRWRETGLLTDVRYGADWRSPATYSLNEVMGVRGKRKERLPEAE